MHLKVKQFIIISYRIRDKFKKLKISTHLCLVINENWKLFFPFTSSHKDPDPGSGSEILDFQFEDPDQEHWFKANLAFWQIPS